MKKNSKKFLLCFGLALIGNYTQAQGLEGIVVEKFYQANAADATNSSDQGASPLLTSGAVTYRIYVNMAAGYKFSQIYGTATSPLQVSTTTNFYNDPNSGSTTNPSSISVLNTRKNTALLDSWFTTGGVAAGKLGVLKSEDTDGSLGNVQGILQNNPGGLFGLPINIGTATSMSAADGMITGTVVAPNVLGISETVELDALNAGTGNNFIATNGAIAALGGVVGPTASNMVLVGQFTTSGVLSYHFNVQLVNIATGVAENYFAVPTGAELTHPSLNLVPNVAPSVSITSPANGASIITGTALTITANSADTDGTVSGVEFFVDNVSIGAGTLVSGVYSKSYTATTGPHSLTAKSTDNSGDVTTSSVISITVAPNQAPSVSLTAATSAIVGDIVALSATSSDVDGTVAQVEFFVDNVSIGTGVLASGAYAKNWTSIIGTHLLKAVSTDNLGLTTTSSTISILVAANTPPSAALTSPVSGASFVAPSVITIAGTATDTDGTITLVEFLVNNVVVGTSTTAPYSFAWTSAFGIKTFNLRSTDDKGAVSTSAGVTLTVANPSALPYAIGTVIQTCNPTTFCVPLAAAVTHPVDNVKGYDLVLNYDKAKITPTGNITLFNNLINSSFVETDNSIDAINGTMNISVSFKSTAPLNSEFNGVGNILCVEFTKTANFMPVDTAIVSMPFLQESYITGVDQKQVSAGKAITYRDQNFPGVLKFWSDNSPIKYNAALPNDYLITTVQGANVATSVLNPNNVKVSPDLTGNFTYNLENGLGININRDIDNANMVQILVNGADAAFAKTIIINGAFTPSIYQLLACDVNRDGVVSAGDVSQMKQRSTNVLAEFQQAWNYNNAGVSNGQPSKDWYFVDSLTVKNNPNYKVSLTFPANDGVGFSKARVPVVPFVLATTVADYVNCPVITSETFKGIMVGDVDGSYAAFTNDGLLKSATTSTNNKVVFDLEKAVRNGNSIDVPVSIISDEPVVALDFAFQFNEDKFVFNTVESKSDEIDGMSHYDAVNKFVRYTSDNLSKFNLNTEVVTIRFDVIDGEISEEDIKSTLGILNGKQVDVEFRSTSINTSANTSVSVYPNPTTGLLNILVSENSIVQLLDLSGKEVLVQSTAAANVKQELNVENLSGGVYILKVYNENFNSIERVVLNK